MSERLHLPYMARLCPFSLDREVDSVLKAVPHSAFDVYVALGINRTVALWGNRSLRTPR